MRKMVLVEDNPWKTLENMKNLNEAGIEIEAILYFAENSLAEADIRLNKFKEESHMKVEIVKTINFDHLMDDYLAKEDVFILSDAFLQAGPMYIGNRIGIQYALKQDEMARKKIYFYSTAGRDIVSFLKERFGKEQVVDVVEVDLNSEQLKWDMDQIKKIAQG